ncbi:MAG: cell division protein ZapE [Paraperlucidibaca sp.]
MANVPAQGPLLAYQQALAQEGFAPDTAQYEAMEGLQQVFDELLGRYERARRARGPARLREIRRQKAPAQGLYLWGGVGRGKTWLMDLFFESVPFRRKLRVHFHRFMQRVHRQLKELEGTSDPLTHVANTLHDEAVVICFDEFFVTDIADAMILGGLFERLFERGVTLVATSNIVPERLYENGLQRQRFLPAIALVQQHCRVLNVDAGIDYRLRVLTQAALYYTPLDRAADDTLKARFEDLCAGQHVYDSPLDVNDRPVKVRGRSEDVLWVSFEELCEQPRSAHDYIELAREYHSVLLSGIPLMGVDNDDAARRFINLIDEFYDRSIKLVVSAEQPILSLYAGGRLSFEFERTQSRLQEMQSSDYLMRPHRP